MKGRFRLEQVLNFRCEVEKVRKQEYAEAKDEFDVADVKLRRDEDEMDRLALECIDRQMEGISAQELQMYSDFFNRKRRDIHAQRDVVTILEDRMQKKRETLLHAAQEKKVLESLKEKKMRTLEREMVEREQRFLDEIALQRSGRGSR